MLSSHGDSEEWFTALLQQPESGRNLLSTEDFHDSDRLFKMIFGAANAVQWHHLR